MADAVDLTPIGRSMQERGEVNAAMYRQISFSLEADRDTGAVKIDREQLRSILSERMPLDSASSFEENLVEVAQGGMLMLDSASVPWVVLEDFAYARQGLPAPIGRELFGRIPFGARPDDMRTRLTDRFPSAPETIFAGDGSVLLMRSAAPIPVPLSTPTIRWGPIVALPGEGWEGPDFDPTEERPSRPHTTGHVGPPVVYGGTPTISGIVAPSPEKAREAALCLLNGSWDGLVRGLPFGAGWALGWSCCIDHDCAEKLADLLAGLGGAEALLAAAEALYTGGIAAAVAAVAALPALTVLAIYGLLLSLNIRVANGPNGVCIYGNWPWVVGMYVWALPA
jgi:hypothetical protein